MRSAKRRSSGSRSKVLLVVTALLVLVAVFLLVRYSSAIFRFFRGDDAGAHYTLQPEDIPDTEEDMISLQNFETLEKEISDSYILIGDSRTKGMNLATNISASPKVTVLAEVGMGYYWMVEEALPSAAGINCYNYVILLGINDLANLDLYLSKYRELISMGVSLTLVTIGPVEEGKGGYTIRNIQIEDFNSRLSEVEGATVLDLYGYMMQSGFSTLDGVHYTDETYYRMLTFLLYHLS